MKKKQLYVPLNQNLYNRLSTTSDKLGIPASNLACELLSQDLRKSTITVKINIHHSTPASKTKDLVKSGVKFGEGYNGHKHHLANV